MWTLKGKVEGGDPTEERSFWEGVFDGRNKPR